MLRRPFEPRLAIFGWLLLAWTVLAHASTAQFVWSVGGQASKWLDAHGWAGGLFGFALLALAVVWRDLSPRLPKWLHPRPTTGERLKAIEFTIEDRIHPIEIAVRMTSDRQHENRERIDRLTSGLDGRTKELEVAIQRSENGLVERLEKLNSEVARSDGRISGLAIRLDEHRPWIADLERTLVVTRKSVDRLCQEIQGVLLFMCDITILLSEADRALAYLERIKNLYPETEAASRPFSRAWWRSDLPVTPVPIVVEWALFQNRHVQHCRDFAVLFHLSESDVLDNGLTLYASSWNSADSWEQCYQRLNSQRAKLSRARQEYAGNFAKRVANPQIQRS